MKLIPITLFTLIITATIGCEQVDMSDGDGLYYSRSSTFTQGERQAEVATAKGTVIKAGVKSRPDSEAIRAVGSAVRENLEVLAALLGKRGLIIVSKPADVPPNPSVPPDLVEVQKELNKSNLDIR